MDFIYLLSSVCVSIVSIPRGWWRGGVWQHSEWRSPLSTLSVHRGYRHYEKGKNTHKHTHINTERYSFLSWAICDSCMCFCDQLLRRNPERRLGSGEKDAEEIKKQPFFRVSAHFLFNIFFLLFFFIFTFSNYLLSFSFFLSASRMWTGRCCCRGRLRPPSSPPLSGRKTSATSTRSSPPNLRHSRHHANLVCSPAKTRRASGTLTTFPTSASGPWRQRGMFDFKGFTTVLSERTTGPNWLSADCLSAVNYTVNECGETRASRSVFCVSTSYKDRKLRK